MSTHATRSSTLLADALSPIASSPSMESVPPASMPGTKLKPTLTLSSPSSLSTSYSSGYTLSAASSYHPALRTPLAASEITSPLPSPEPKKSVHWAPLPLPPRPEGYDGKVYRKEQTGLGLSIVGPGLQQRVVDPNEGGTTKVEDKAE